MARPVPTNKAADLNENGYMQMSDCERTAGEETYTSAVLHLVSSTWERTPT